MSRRTLLVLSLAFSALAMSGASRACMGCGSLSSGHHSSFLQNAGTYESGTRTMPLLHSGSQCHFRHTGWWRFNDRIYCFESKDTWRRPDGTIRPYVIDQAVPLNPNLASLPQPPPLPRPPRP